MTRISRLPALSARPAKLEHTLGKGEVVSSILTGSTMFVGFFQCHASANIAGRRGTMRERAAVWTQIGHTKSRSVHRSDWYRRRHGIVETFELFGSIA